MHLNKLEIRKNSKKKERKRGFAIIALREKLSGWGQKLMGAEVFEDSKIKFGDFETKERSFIVH